MAITKIKITTIKISKQCDNNYSSLSTNYQHQIAYIVFVSYSCKQCMRNSYVDYHTKTKQVIKHNKK